MHQLWSIPELVEHILSFVLAVPIECVSDGIEAELANNEHHSAARLKSYHRRRCLLVCRLWYTVDFRQRLRVLHWNNGVGFISSGNPLSVFSSIQEFPCIATCQRLVTHFDMPPLWQDGSEEGNFDDDQEVRWKRLLALVHSTFRTGSTTGSEASPSALWQQQRDVEGQPLTTTLFTWYPEPQCLREIVLRGYPDVMHNILPLLSIPILHHAITLIDLHFEDYKTIDLNHFFNSPLPSPFVAGQEVSVTGPTSTTISDASDAVKVPNLRHFYLYKARIVNLADHWLSAVPVSTTVRQPQQLVSLAMDKVSTSTDTVLVFLIHTVGSKTEHLRLRSLELSPPLQPAAASAASSIHSDKVLVESISSIPSGFFRDVLALRASSLVSLEVQVAYEADLLDAFRFLVSLFGTSIKEIRVDDWRFELDIEKEGGGEDGSHSHVRILKRLVHQGSSQRFLAEKLCALVKSKDDASHLEQVGGSAGQ